MRTVENGNFVSVDYTGTLEDGEVFDSSEGRSPLQFQVGSGDLIEGFDRAVLGMAVDQEKQFTLSPEQAYGHRDEDMVRQVPRSMLEGDGAPEPGQMVMVQTADGESMPVVITEVTPEYIALDANHPLAGKALTFKIKMLSISDVAPECGCGPNSCGPGCGDDHFDGGCDCGE